MDKDSILNYIELLRLGHWFKNIVVLFGAIAAIIYFKIDLPLLALSGKIFLAIFLACIISSVNYGVNNICDEKNDMFHPIKKNRALPSKRISKGTLLLTISLLLIGSLFLSKFVYGNMVTIWLFSLFIAGIFYNVKPLRFKNIAFLDVISESINNPIRILIGWYSVSVSSVVPPVTFLLLFWSLGAIMMSAKRYAELNYLLSYNGKVSPHLYRNSYKFYSLQNIFIVVLFYSLASVSFMTFLSIKYQPKLLFSLPIILIYFIWLLLIMKRENSPFRDPEKIFLKEKFFSLITWLIIVMMFLLFFLVGFK